MGRATERFEGPGDSNLSGAPARLIKKYSFRVQGQFAPTSRRAWIWMYSESKYDVILVHRIGLMLVCLQVLVEPVTGRVWERSIQLELTVGVTNETAHAQDRNIRATHLPLPVIWTERRTTITDSEVKAYIHLVSCGSWWLDV
jgi:hypothetical protein